MPMTFEVDSIEVDQWREELGLPTAPLPASQPDHGHSCWVSFEIRASGTDARTIRSRLWSLLRGRDPQRILSRCFCFVVPNDRYFDWIVDRLRELAAAHTGEFGFAATRHPRPKARLWGQVRLLQPAVEEAEYE